MVREIILSLLAIALGAFMVSRISWRLGLIDQPNARSSHSRATPKGGGVGMAAAFLFAAIVSMGRQRSAIRNREFLRIPWEIFVNRKKDLKYRNATSILRA